MARRFADTGKGFITIEAKDKDVAEQARTLVQKAFDKNAKDKALVKALADAAVRWNKHAETFRWRGPDAETIRTFYKEKAQRAIDEAGRIVHEGRKG